jgi:hypothetical protein
VFTQYEVFAQDGQAIAQVKLSFAQLGLWFAQLLGSFAQTSHPYAHIKLIIITTTKKDLSLKKGPNPVLQQQYFFKAQTS